MPNLVATTDVVAPVLSANEGSKITGLPTIELIKKAMVTQPFFKWAEGDTDCA